MKQELTAQQCIHSNRINRLFYGLYLSLVVYLLMVGDYEMAIINLGIALVFDPFDSQVKWDDRTRFQKAWLLCHVTLSIAGILFLLFR